jgi:[ribosomal protein S5]-alanine N-acetyltransferase
MDQNLPSILTQHCLLKLPELEESKLMCDFVIQNKVHLLPWEPLQPDSYYTNSFWSTEIAQIRKDFLSDTSCCLNIYLQENQALIGMIKFSNFMRGAFQSCFLGFKISQSMQGKGLMTEALDASISYVFKTLNLHRIAANYMPHNSASARVLEKSGFRQEGNAEDYLCINGKWENHVLTSRINYEWENKHRVSNSYP